MSGRGHKKSLREWIPFWVIPLIVILSIGTVWLRLSIVRTTYSIGQIDRQIRGLQEAREQMDLRMAALRSPRRLEILARTRFGLGQPKAEQIIAMPAPQSHMPQIQ